MELMGMPLWTWVVFYILVFIMLIIDLKMFARKGEHEVSISEALKMTAVWIAVSLVFCAGIYLWYPVDPQGKSMEFLAGYLIEKSLSMDNLFVFLMLFSFFGVERKYQHEVLFWGIFGALVLRSIFIFAGAAMVERFEWILGLFGLFLIYTGIKMFGHDDDEQVDPANNIFVRLFKRFFPVTDQMHGDKFFIWEQGRRLATPLFIALIVIETTDVAFAVDSIPAVFSVSRDPFIVLTSNIFAILGLRALYFALAAIAKYFGYLKYGLGIILSFVGIKMLLAMDEYVNALGRLCGVELNMPHIEVPTPWSLAFIFGVLLLSILLSVVANRRKAAMLLVAMFTTMPAWALEGTGGPRATYMSTASLTLHDHVFAEAWSYDADDHWHACTAAGNSAACLDDDGAEKAAHTYGTEGSARYTCGVCGYFSQYRYYSVQPLTLLEGPLCFTVTKGTSYGGDYDGTGSDDEEGCTRLFDGKYTSGNCTKWCVKSADGYYVEFQASEPIVPASYVLITGDDNISCTDRNPRTWTIRAKLNENDEWTTIAAVSDDGTMQNLNYTAYTFSFDNDGNRLYRYFRFDISATQGADIMQLSEMQIWARKLQAPTDLTLNYTGGTTATVTWSGSASGSATAFDIDVNGIVTENVTSPYTLTDLELLSPYTVKVHANDGHDVSPWASVRFIVPDPNSITLNDGTDLEPMIPFNGAKVDDGYRSQFIIPAADLASLKWASLNKLVFYTETESVDFDEEYTVYIKEVSGHTFPSAIFEDWGSMTPVYTGSVAISNNLMAITLTTPFTYEGDDLLIGFQETAFGSVSQDIDWYGVYPEKKTITALYNRASKSHKWSSSIVRTDFAPKVTIAFTPGSEPSCPKPTAPTVNDITSKSAQLSWTPGGSETAWTVYYKMANDADYSSVAVSGNPSCTLNGLRVSTVYEYYVVGNWPEDEESHPSVVCRFTTDCGVIDYFPWKEDFNSLTENKEIPPCWDNEEGTVTSAKNKWSYRYGTGVGNTTGTSYDASHCVRFDSKNSKNTRTNFLKTPILSLPANTPMQLSFWFKNPKGGDFSVYISTDGGKNYEKALATDLTNQNSWTKKAIALDGYAGEETVVIMFKGTSNKGSGDAYIYLDDVTVAPKPTLPMPSNLTANGVDIHSAELNWTEEGEATHWQICLNGDEKHPIEAGTNPFTLSGLDDNTCYTAMVRAYQSETEYSEWSDEVVFTTLDANPMPANRSVEPMTFSATISWIGLGDTYDVEYVEAGSTAEWTTVNTTVPTVTISGLMPETYYQYRVRSVLGNRISDWTPTASFSTTKLDPPTDVKLETIPSQITLSWKGEGESYNVKIHGCSILSEGFESELSDWELRNCRTNSGRSDQEDTHTDDGSFVFVPSSTPQYLISPCLTGVYDQEMLEFWYRGDDTKTGTFQMGYSTTDKELSSFTWSEDIHADGDNWHQFCKEIPFGTKYICWKSVSNGEIVLIDDILVYDKWKESSTTEPTIIIGGIFDEIPYEYQIQSVVGNKVSDWTPLTTFSLAPIELTGTHVTFSYERGESLLFITTATMYQKVTVSLDLENLDEDDYLTGTYLSPDGLTFTYDEYGNATFEMPGHPVTVVAELAKRAPYTIDLTTAATQEITSDAWMTLQRLDGYCFGIYNADTDEYMICIDMNLDGTPDLQLVENIGEETTTYAVRRLDGADQVTTNGRFIVATIPGLNHSPYSTVLVKLNDSDEEKVLPVIVPGDANGDGNVTVTDIAVVVNCILKLPNTGGYSEYGADANSDGFITVTDIGVIVDKILGTNNASASSRRFDSADSQQLPQGLEPQ